MKEKLMKISELGHLLDYNDSRSIENWCKKNKIPIMAAGKQRYVLTVFVDQYFSNYLNKFVSANYSNANEIMTAIESNDSILLSELMNVPVDSGVKKEFKEKIKHSKAGQEFLNKIKTA